MIRVYGIKNCDSVRKTVKYLKSKEIDYIFIDFRETPVNESEIRSWIKNGASPDKLFNNRGTTYRTLKLKELNLDDEGKIAWLAKENMLIKRPVIVLDDNSIHVGYNETEIRKL
jgi:Spx/MgsR family transcriptional regulator